VKNKVSALGFLSDAEIILEEANTSFERRRWHRVVRKCQEATELSVKALFKYLGLEYPKSHILGRLIKKEIGRHKLFENEELNKIAFITDALAFDREPSFNGSPGGVAESELFAKDDAEEALKNSEWPIRMIRAVLK